MIVTDTPYKVGPINFDSTIHIASLPQISALSFVLKHVVCQICYHRLFTLYLYAIKSFQMKCCQCFSVRSSMYNHLEFGPDTNTVWTSEMKPKHLAKTYSCLTKRSDSPQIWAMESGLRPSAVWSLCKHVTNEDHLAENTSLNLSCI